MYDIIVFMYVMLINVYLCYSVGRLSQINEGVRRNSTSSDDSFNDSFSMVSLFSDNGNEYVYIIMYISVNVVCVMLFAV